jgi:hypothetical protein
MKDTIDCRRHNRGYRPLLHGVPFERIERNEPEGADVSRTQLHWWRDAHRFGFQPAQRTYAPSVAGFQAGKIVFGPRRLQIVALRSAEIEKGLGHHGRNDMPASIMVPGAAVTIAIEASDRTGAAGRERMAENIEVGWFGMVGHG